MTNFKLCRLKDINIFSIGRVDVPRNEIFAKILKTMHMKNLGKYKILHKQRQTQGSSQEVGWMEYRNA